MNKGKEKNTRIHYTKKDQVTEITEKDAIFLYVLNKSKIRQQI